MKKIKHLKDSCVCHRVCECVKQIVQGCMLLCKKLTFRLCVCETKCAGENVANSNCVCETGSVQPGACCSAVS